MAVFLVSYIYKFCYNNDYLITTKTYLRHAFFTIAVKLRLVLSKTNKKDKIGDQKNVFANFIFLNVVISNIHNAFGANHFIP